jgi:hypothetical protein
MGRNAFELFVEDIQFEFLIYGRITNYSMFELRKVKTKDEFKIYYTNLLIGAVLHEWYKERKAGLLLKKLERQ